MKQVFSNSKEDSRIIVMLSNNSNDKNSKASINLQQIKEIVNNFDASDTTLQSVAYSLHYLLNKSFQDITLHIHIGQDTCSYYAKYNKGTLANVYITEEENDIYYMIKYESERLGGCNPRIITENIRFNMYGSKGQVVHCTKVFRNFQDKFLDMVEELRLIERDT